MHMYNPRMILLYAFCSRVTTKVGCLAMSRPLLLVTLLLLMVLTSQLDWKQKIVNEVEARSLALSRKQQYVLEMEESVKEKIILSQEKHIQKLKTLVQSLQEQLLLCRGKDEFVNDTMGSLTELLNELKQQKIME
ncbi:uncharacterized protein LOC112521446 [Cynara cardunculus var. scolymus]|uniref:uncharacterized protein LOC112521446 n=1 Tax=Cynara cardunculus var. scolymus TaxID=59895 RepID=UPI000D628FD0|nr:uncharacterized protein LOC112521446 [Cynara cardunculus var. scolymus]